MGDTAECVRPDCDEVYDPEQTDGGDRIGTVRVNGDTALYTTQTEGGDPAPATQPIPERSADSGVVQSTATFGPSRCPACERAFSDQDDIPTFFQHVAPNCE